MNHTIRRTLAPLGLIVAGACFAGSAHAGCAPDAMSQVPTMQKEAWHGDAARMMQVDWRHHDDDIVGMWNIVVTGKGNGNSFDGTIVDHGLQHWHDDGTEYLNSENHNPSTQNFCMGIWEQTGPWTYRTNHFAFSYNSGTSINEPTFVVRIRQEVTLSHDGNELSGKETTDIYTPDGNLVVSIKGVLVGKRVTMDTTARDIH